jgi:hypothetical protein
MNCGVVDVREEEDLEFPNKLFFTDLTSVDLSAHGQQFIFGGASAGTSDYAPVRLIAAFAPKKAKTEIWAGDQFETQLLNLVR